MQSWLRTTQPIAPRIYNYSTTNYSKIDSIDKFLKNIELYNKLNNMSEDPNLREFFHPEKIGIYLDGLPNKILEHANIYESGWEDFKKNALNHASPDPDSDTAGGRGGRRMRSKTRRIRRKQNKRRLTKKYI